MSNKRFRKSSQKALKLRPTRNSQKLTNGRTFGRADGRMVARASGLYTRPRTDGIDARTDGGKRKTQILRHASRQLLQIHQGVMVVSCSSTFDTKCCFRRSDCDLFEPNEPSIMHMYIFSLHYIVSCRTPVRRNYREW